MKNKTKQKQQNQSNNLNFKRNRKKEKHHNSLQCSTVNNICKDIKETLNIHLTKKLRYNSIREAGAWP